MSRPLWKATCSPRRSSWGRTGDRNDESSGGAGLNGCDSWQPLPAPCSSLPDVLRRHPPRRPARRSEEHTSELQSLAYLVCRLLLEKKKEMTFVQHPPPV